MNNPKIKLVITFLSLIILFGCGNKTESKTEIPEILAKDHATKEYFETLDQVIEEYISMSKKIIETSKKAEKNNEEPNFSDALQMLNAVTTSTMEMAPLLQRMEELKYEPNMINEDMSMEEIEAFSKTYTKIMARFYEMSNN